MKKTLSIILIAILSVSTAIGIAALLSKQADKLANVITESAQTVSSTDTSKENQILSYSSAASAVCDDAISWYIDSDSNNTLSVIR